ncbi:MAG: spore germination protein [Clostridia bacterium]|nr:spore germination protein [Clostridia bacterium]
MQKAKLTDQFDHNRNLIQNAVQIQKNEDMKFRQFSIAGHKAAVVFIDGMVDLTRLQHFILSPCMQVAAFPENVSIADHLSGQVLEIASLDWTEEMDMLLLRICQGDAAILCDGMQGALIGEVKGYARRSVGQPVNETVVMGPHEGFCETMRDNVVLIRKILRTPALISEAVMIGDQTPSRVCILYLNGVAPMESVDEIKRRIANCHVDHVSSLGMLEQLLEDNPFSLMPQAVTTERPDRAASFLSEGQVVILMENAPTALAMPAGLFHLYHAPDDTSMRWQYGTFLRLLRMAGMLIALFLPAVYVAMTVFHPEGMSLSLLTSVLESQSKVPMTLFPSMLLMLLAFSLINEAGARVPGAMGASLSIVGGIILGQAVVEADMFSPLLIVVVAISGLGTYAMPTYPLTMAIRIMQLMLVVLAGLAGYPGIIMGAFLLLVRICGLTSLGHPYLSPLSPARPANPDLIVRLPIWRQRLRGYMANAFRMQRTTGPMRAWDKEEK